MVQGPGFQELFFQSHFSDFFARYPDARTAVSIMGNLFRHFPVGLP
jgi:hypothetical protein